MEQHDNLGFFVSKTDLLQTVSSLFDSLIDIVAELERIRSRVQHLKRILMKDLLINSQKNTNTEKIQMTIAEWNEYILKNDSDEETNC